MGMNDLPDACPKTEGYRDTYQANHDCPCYNYVVTVPVRLIALMPRRVCSLDFFICMPEIFDYGLVWLGR